MSSQVTRSVDSELLRLKIADVLSLDTYRTLTDPKGLSKNKDKLILSAMSNPLLEAHRRYLAYVVLIEKIPQVFGGEVADSLLVGYLDQIHEVTRTASAALSRVDDMIPPTIQLTFNQYAQAAFEGYPILASDALLAKHRANAKSFLKNVITKLQWNHALALTSSLASEFLNPLRETIHRRPIKTIQELHFPPEFKQAGIAILSYFAEVLRQRHPDVPTAVSIAQEGPRVVMTITHPDGSTQEIVRTFHEYKLVVRGERTPGELLGDRLQAAALQNKLDLAAVEIRSLQQLLQIERDFRHERVHSLERDVSRLYNLLGKELLSQREMVAGIVQMTTPRGSSDASDAQISIVTKLVEAIEVRDSALAVEAIRHLRESETDLFTRIGQAIYSGVFSGVVGNAAYDWLKVLWPVLPK